MARDAKEIEVDERHPFRFMFKLAVFVGLVYAVGRFLAQKKNELAGLTESQAREKFVGRMGRAVGDETATEIADQVIPKLKDRGLIKADQTEATGDGAAAAADEGEEAAEESADQVTEAVDSVVKD